MNTLARSAITATCVLTCAATFALLAAAPARATTYITSDRSIAGGNPLNTPTGGLVIGRAGNGSFFSGVDLDITAGAAIGSGDVSAYSDSRTTIHAGTFNAPWNNVSAEYSSVTIDQAAQLRLTGNVNLGIVRVQGSGNFEMDAGRVGPLQVTGAEARATVNGGTVASRNSFTISEASSQGAQLTFNGGSTVGVVRASGGGLTRVNGGSHNLLHASSRGFVELAGGLPASGGQLVATNKGAGTEGFFTVFGTGLSLSNAFAGSFYDPTYVITNPGVFFTLTGTLLDGQEIRATYFEEGLQIGQAARLISFTSAVPEPGAWALMLAGLGVVTVFRRRA